MKIIYAGKAKDIIETNNVDEVICRFRDSATAGNGEKKDEIKGKGVINNQITEMIFTYLVTHDIETHFIKRISSREQLLKKVDIIPLEIIIRNIAAGHFSSRYGVKEGKVFKNPTFELSYKNDEFGDPLLNEDHAIAMKIITSEEYIKIKLISLKINSLLIELFKNIGIILVDFKLEFGRLPNGEILLADEFSPDNSRLWDAKTMKKLDKDNFRENLGDLMSAYHIVHERLKNEFKKS